MLSGFQVPAYRRSMTPVTRRIRAVQMRHNPFHKKAAGTAAVSSDVKQPEKPAEVQLAQASASTFRKIEEVKPNRRQVRKERRKAQEEDVLRRLANEPQTSFAEMLFNPSLTMEKVAATDDITLSRGSIFLIYLLKWLVVGFSIANNMARFINRHGFSIATMSFSGMADTAFRIFAFGLVMDCICTLITGLFGFMADRRFSVRKFNAVKVRYYPAQMLGYMITALAGDIANAAGAAVYTAVLVFSIIMRFHTYQLTCRFSTRRQLMIISLNVILCTVAGLVYGHYAFGQLEKVLLYILNI